MGEDKLSTNDPMQYTISDRTNQSKIMMKPPRGPAGNTAGRTFYTYVVVKNGTAVERGYICSSISIECNVE
jgi:hypothetical protein